MTFYFAYGSNMDPARMCERVKRVPEARRAHLQDHELCFNKRSTKDGTGKANIVRRPGRVVWGVVFSCTEEDMKNLDGAEGGYRREPVEVHYDDGSACKAIAYVARTECIAEELAPTAEYRQHILVGARHFELPDDYVCRLESA